MPLPDFVTPPVPEITPADLAVSPAPSTVSVNPAVVTAPLKVNVPATDVAVALAARVIAPETVLLLARLRSAPPEETPVPLKVSGSATVRPVPLTTSAAPAETVVPVPVPPRDELLLISSIPAVTDAAPVNVFVALSASVPLPPLVGPPAPLMTALSVSVAAESETPTVLAAPMATCRLIVFVDAAPVAEIPATPIAIRFPASVYPAPEIVIELKGVSFGKLLVFESRAAPAGNTRSSPATGAVPPQLAAVCQLALPAAPVHVLVAEATYGPTNGPPSPLGPVPFG